MGRLSAVIGLGSLLAFAGCGGGGADGEPLLSGALTGQYKGEAFTPTSGFATVYKGKNLVGIGDGPLNCDSPQATAPPAGVNVAFTLPTLDVGSYSSVLVMIHYNRGDYEASGTNSGIVTVSASTETSFAGSIAYSYTNDEGDTSGVSGTFEVIRCPE